MFKSAILRLTVFYLLIIMVISIGFSVMVYKLYFHEFGSGLGRQTGILSQAPDSCSKVWPVKDLEKISSQQLAQSSANLKRNLIYFNGLILILSGVFSYFFAKKTLQPIEDMVIAQKRFTADASHELKTPLTAMKTEIEVNVRDKKLSTDAAVKLLKSNLEEIGKLETLSNALLNLAKYQEDEKREFKIVSLSDIVADAYQDVRKLANKKNVKFVNKIEDVKILADPDSLKELFVILFDNSIKYSPANKKIYLSSKKFDHHIRIIVRDEGRGISKENLEHVFDRFFRADQSRSKEETPGFGLGLAIAKSITQLHEGKISLKSDVGKGTTFFIELPKKT